MRLLLERIIDDQKQTIGRLYVLGKNDAVLFNCNTIELPWRHNQKRISCIPTGTFNVIKHRSRKFGPCLWILKVPFRSEILIHKGNYYKDTLGCVLPGMDIKDINKDGLLDVTASGDAMDKLLELLPKKFEIEILQNPKFVKL